jgi:L-lactate dehydrogenase complex protein LldE
MGATAAGTRLAQRHLDIFQKYETIVCPSGSCTATVRRRYPEFGVGADEAGHAQRARTFELGEFLVRRLERTGLGARFPHRVAVLSSCHGLRDLGLGSASENLGTRERSPTEVLLGEVEGLSLVPSLRDECCGFGGSFAVRLPEVSARMGRARLREWADAGAEYVTGTDVSCLLHLEGIRQREGSGPEAIHLAEILARTEDR